MTFRELTVENADILRKIANEYYCALKWRDIKKITELFFGKKAAYIVFNWRIRTEEDHVVFKQISISESMIVSSWYLLEGCCLYDNSNHKLTFDDANQTSQLFHDAYNEAIVYNQLNQTLLIDDVIYFAICLVFEQIWFESNDAFFKLAIREKYDLTNAPIITYPIVYTFEHPDQF